MSEWKIVKKGETVSKATRVVGSVVEADRTTKVPGIGEVAHSWTLDFDAVSQEDVLKLAARTVIITLQARLRKQGKAAKPEDWDGKAFDVQKEIVEVERRSKPADQKILEQWEHLTDEARERLLQQLMGQKQQGQ